MKPLKLAAFALTAGLAFPASINAFPWGNKEIVVKTDLGEKYVVKSSAVKVTPWTKSDAIADFENKKFHKPGSPDYLKYLNILKSSKIKIPYVLIEFRPIFIDLNNKKEAQGYIKTTCTNYDKFKFLPKEEFTELTKAYLYALYPLGRNFPDTSTGLAIETVKLKVCEKYAKF